jgi:hypothetical protein
LTSPISTRVVTRRKRGRDLLPGRGVHQRPQPIDEVRLGRIFARTHEHPAVHLDRRPLGHDDLDVAHDGRGDDLQLRPRHFGPAQVDLALAHDGAHLDPARRLPAPALFGRADKRPDATCR